ncbi:MAG: hypothetical protein GYA24_06160, partial [Candidatus Lokiarchaeota archaeon]|nr:hypothetical protein [Candidatus Lokiarchaeota archaeon]
MTIPAFLCPAQVDIELGRYVRSRRDAIPEPAVVAAIDAYKENVASMLARLDPGRLYDLAAGTLPSQEDRLATGLNGTLLVSIKHDGIGVFAVHDRAAAA